MIHLLRGLARWSAGESTNSHDVLRLGVQALLGTQVEAAQQSLHGTLGNRGHPPSVGDLHSVHVWIMQTLNNSMRHELMWCVATALTVLTQAPCTKTWL